MKLPKFIVATLIVAVPFAKTSAEAPLNHPIIPVHAQLEHEGSSSLILLGDPQSFVKFMSTQPLFDLQTAWIAENIDDLNIKGVLITGDMVETNNTVTTESRPINFGANRTSRQMWEASSRALERLDNRVPYMIAQGNHDAGILASENRMSFQPDYFYPERNVKFETTLVSTAPNINGIHTMENAAYEITMPGWDKLLIIATEFAPRDEVLDWARELAESDRYRNDHVIFLTHSFLNNKGEIIKKENYKLEPRNWARAIWNKLIAPSSNIDMVVCGHSCYIPTINADTPTPNDVDFSRNSAFRVETANDGRQVPMMMFNVQTNDGEWYGNGGDCWLRILEFLPDGETVSVRTFSPLFALSKFTGHMAWRTQPYDQFTFKIPKHKTK